MAGPPDQLTEKMLTAYIALCTRDSVLNVTLQKTAKHAKVPFATAHYHWGGKKKELVVEALKFIGARAQHYIEKYLNDSALKHKNMVEAYATGTFQWVIEHRGEAQLWLFFYHHLAAGSSTPEVGMSFVTTARLRVERLITESVGNGFYSRPKDLSLAGSVIHSFVFSNGIFAIMSRSDPKTKDLLKLTIKQINQTLT